METALPILTIIKYFQTQHIGAVSLLLPCSGQGELVLALKEMSTFGMMTSFSIQTIREKTEFRSGAVLHLACHYSRKTLQNMSERKLFSLDREWLFLENVTQTQNFSGTSLEANTKELYMLPNSRATLLQYSPSEDSMAVYDLYRIVTWTPIMYNLMLKGQMKGIGPLHLTRKKRHNFNGVTLRHVTVIAHRNEFRGFGKYENLDSDFYSKTIIIMAQDMAFHLNFRIALLVENSYGYKDKNGHFDGMMGKIERGEIEYGTGVLMREDRWEITDYTGDVNQLRAPLIFKQPSLSSVENIFLLPFSRGVWIGAVVSSVLFGIILYVSHNIGDTMYSLADRNDLSLGETVTTILSCICQQGPPAINTAPRGRIALFLFELTIFFLFVAYSAKIVALLQSSIEKIKTISDLTNSPLEVGIQNQTYLKLLFEEATDPDLRQFYLKKIKPYKDKAYIEPTEGIKKLKSGMFAYEGEYEWAHSIISKTFQESEKCGLSEFTIAVMPILGLPMPKRSGLREHFTWSLAKLTEVGLKNRANNFLPMHKEQCNSRVLYRSVYLIDFMPALEVMGFGVMLSISFLSAEILWKLRKNFPKVHWKFAGRKQE